MVDDALEAFRAGDSADAIRAMAQEGSGGGTNSLSDQGVHDIMRTDLIPTHSQTKSRGQLLALIKDIQQNGIQEPVKYVVFDGKKYVVDGHHRILAAKKLGLLNIPAEEVELPYLGYQTTNDLLWFD